jgi:hypothetical protein
MPDGHSRRETRARTVTKPQSLIDRRPFQSKADREREEALEAQYRRVAIPEVVAALGQAKQDEATKAA